MTQEKLWSPHLPFLRRKILLDRPWPPTPAGRRGRPRARYPQKLFPAAVQKPSEKMRFPSKKRATAPAKTHNTDFHQPTRSSKERPDGFKIAFRPTFWPPAPKDSVTSACQNVGAVRRRLDDIWPQVPLGASQIAWRRGQAKIRQASTPPKTSRSQRA